MGRIVQLCLDRFDLWLWQQDLQRRERALQRHFRGMQPDAVVDIDKYLRCHGFLP